MKDRLYQDGEATDVYRHRHLSDADAEQLQSTTATKSYNDWCMIHQNAE